jgi:NAD+ kinase
MERPMNRIAVVHNPHSPASEHLSRELSAWLNARGIETWRGHSAEARAPHAMDNIDLIVALGGDGTVLRAAHLALAAGVPVLPVALGHLNFMAELLPENLYDGLETLLNGGGWYDVRTMLDAEIHHDHAGGAAPVHTLALNEVLVARGDINRTLVVDVQVYDAPLTTYHADGVIVSTATGSTAYALSAGGPIIDPRSRAVALVPVAAHLTVLPSLVLHEDAVVTLTLRSRYAAAFSSDGRDHLPLHEGDVVVVRRAEQTCTFARVYPQTTFYSRMTRRLRRD